jgi:hypothetical protein
VSSIYLIGSSRECEALTLKITGYLLFNSSATPSVQTFSKRECNSISGKIYTQLWSGHVASCTTCPHVPPHTCPYTYPMYGPTHVPRRASIHAPPRASIHAPPYTCFHTRASIHVLPYTCLHTRASMHVPPYTRRHTLAPNPHTHVACSPLTRA